MQDCYGPEHNGVTEAVGALRDFLAWGPQLIAYVKCYDRHEKVILMIRNRAVGLSQLHGKDESVWVRDWGSGAKPPGKFLQQDCYFGLKNISRLHLNFLRQHHVLLLRRPIWL